MLIEKNFIHHLIKFDAAKTCHNTVTVVAVIWSSNAMTTGEMKKTNSNQPSERASVAISIPISQSQYIYPSLVAS